MSEGKSQQQQHLSIELDFENEELETPHTADSAGAKRARIGQHRVGNLLVQVYERPGEISPEKVLLKLTRELVSFLTQLLSAIRYWHRIIASAPFFSIVSLTPLLLSLCCCCCIGIIGQVTTISKEESILFQRSFRST
jgi:hypothetical protein